MKKLLTITIASLLLAAPLAANAAQAPRASALDSRIKVIEYRDSQVYSVRANEFQDTLIVFSPAEEVTHLGAGDPLAWTMKPMGNYLSIKPILEKPDTNLNVLTTNSETGKVRSYSFELLGRSASSVHDPEGTWQLRFSYPEDELAKLIAANAVANKERSASVVPDRKTSAEQWNMEYTFSGNTDLVPVRAFDDGEFTYLQFPEKIGVPAIFEVDDEKNETLVNYHVKGKYIVIQKIAKQYILRNGNKATCIFNGGYNPGEPTVLKEEKPKIASNKGRARK